MIIRKVKVTEYEYQAPINYVAGATEPDIQFQLTDYEIPSGATGRVYVGRSDGTFEYTVATISGNNVTVAPTSSMFSVKGAGAIQVTLYVGNEVVKNFAVPVYVHADLADDAAHEGSDVTGVFRAAEEQALADFQEQAEEIAEEVRESIPEDYTELTEEVEQLNERLSNNDEVLYERGEYTAKRLGTFLKSYVCTGRIKFNKGIILQSAKAQSGTPTFYKFTRNFFKIDDAEKNGITLTHTEDGKIVLNGTATQNTDFTVALPVALDGQFYGTIKGSSTKNVYVYLRTASAIGAQMTLANATTDSFDRNVSGIVRYQLIIVSGETFSDYELEIGVEWLYNETSADNPYSFEKPTSMVVASFPIESDVDFYLSPMTTSQVLVDTSMLSGKTVVRVNKNGGGDYSSILQALRSTPDFVKVYVENGTYNIVDEYKAVYGADFWTNYDGYATHKDPFYRGLWISDNRVIECDAWAKIVWDYDGANTSVNGLFSVFATGQDATIINAHIIFNANCRYAIHDDYAAFGGTNRFLGCIFDGTSSNGTTIGAGCGHRNTYIIKDCLFLNDGTYDISYHNTGGLGINHIIVTGCCGTGQLKFGWYGNSTEITECIASNNKFGSIVCEAHNSSATNENMHMSAWNNVVGA